MDEQVVRPPAEASKRFNALTRQFVCVRVTNMKHVDLNVYVFDYDLTFALLLMNADGTIYHRYGGRDHRGPMAWMSLPSFAEVLRTALTTHTEYTADPKPPAPKPRRTIMDIESFQARIGSKKVDCVHCHNVQPALHAEAQTAGTWSRKAIWIWPSPERVGLQLDPAHQTKVVTVLADSPAAKAGLERGNRLVQLGTQKIASISDAQAALQFASGDATTIEVRFQRDDEEQKTLISLPADWKTGNSLTFSWRPSKWELSPAPGFGGKALSAKQKEKLGIPVDRFAFRLDYRVTWGPRKYLGANVAKAGLREGDIITALDGKSDFVSVDHYHSWFRLTRKIGQEVRVDFLRGGKAMSAQLPVVR